MRASGAQTPRAVVLGAATPYATYVLIALNVIGYLWAAAAAGTSSPPTTSRVMYDGGLVPWMVADGEYWRLLSSGFLHFSVVHIAVNMISLFLIGAQLERTLGTARYTAVYLISLLGGSAAVMWFSGDNTMSAGASGAIYGLMGALLIVVVKARQPLAPILAIIALNIVLTVTIPGISLWAHLGGLLFGALATAAVVFAPDLLSTRSRTAVLASRLGWAGLAALLVIVLALSVVRGVTYSDSDSYQQIHLSNGQTSSPDQVSPEYR